MKRLSYQTDTLPALLALGPQGLYGGEGWRMSGRYYRGPCPWGCDDDQRRARGSLSVSAQTLRYRCWRCQRKGSPLDYLAEGGPVTAATFRAAEELAGLSSGPAARAKPPRPAPAPAKRASPEGRPPKLPALQAVAEGSPAAAYLAGRWLRLPGAEAMYLGGAVGWAGAAEVRRACPRWRLPDDGRWAGCLVWRYGPPGGGPPSAAKLEALTVDGALVEPRWRRNIGKLAGLACKLVDLPGGRWHVAEGEVSAMALALRALALGRGAALACGGTSGLRAEALPDDGRPVAVWPDADPQGLAAALRLRDGLRAEGRSCELRGGAGPGGGWDAADALADWAEERAGVLEFDGGLPRPEADIEAARLARAELAEGGIL